MQQDKIDIIISVVATSLFVLLLVISAFFLFRIYLKRKNNLLLEKERMNIEFEQTLLKSQLEIQENTFNEISREIHDNIGQALSLVRLNLNTLQAPGEEERLERMDDLIGRVIADLRSLSHSLDSDYIRRHGWVNPVEKLLNGVQKAGKYSVAYTIDTDLPQLGSDKPIILFRMIQEVVNNILRHASATAINFEARQEQSRILIRIGDNGKGFDPGSVAAGVGLKNLRSRSKMIDADLDIISQPGNGTAVTIAINPAE